MVASSFASWTIKVRALALGAGLALLGTACSGGQEDEEKPEVSDEEAAAPEGEETAEAEAAPAPAPAEEPAAAAPAPAPAAPAALPTPTGGVEAARVVRYVKQDETPIHDHAADKAPTVGMLNKGDKVMVVVEGEWGRIADGMFVRTSHLSKKALARTKHKASWHKPAK